MRSALLFSILLTACGGSNRTRPHDMTAAEHLRQAAEHGATAARTGGDGGGYVPALPSSGSPYLGGGWSPWYYYWDPAAEHQELGAKHASAAAAVRQEHAGACAGIAVPAQSLSPFDEYALDSHRLADGVVVHLDAQAGPPERFLTRLRCHRAWLRLENRDDEPHDLIALDGAKVVVHAGARDALEVMLSSNDLLVAAELDRRAQIAVLRATQRRGAAAPR